MELLAPAGSMEALRAAVCNGADAVYLGADTFNARINARNFSAADLQEAVVYCHVRGVKVHLTLNTLVLDREMPRAAELIRLAASCGVDAFIVQDLGVVSLCRQLAPDVPIHASTQMSIHSLEGVMEAAALGCSRVVLARELPAEEIAHICKRSPVEIEVFVHGALCMCYSGQCYLSSVIGRRSGNRGRCAQPCRLPYGVNAPAKKAYPLSLKDSCLAGRLEEMGAMGVSCVKLEGRMKRPEYVAVITSVYRRLLDEKRRPTREEQRQLELAFSRSGWPNPLGILPRSEIQNVSYRLRQQQLERLSFDQQDPLTGSQPTVRVLLREVTAFRLRFYADGRWQETWDRPQRLPQGLEITLTLANRGEITRLFLLTPGGGQ